MIIPKGAQAVIDARLKGFKPAEMLIISLIGPVGESNHTIFANSTIKYDWRWIVGLEVCIYTYKHIDWRPLAAHVGVFRPEWLGVYYPDLFKGLEAFLLPRVEDIEKPRNLWKWQLHTIPWLEFQNRQFAWGE